MILKNDVRVGNLVSIGGSDFFSRIDTIDRYTACVTRDGYTFVSVNWNDLKGVLFTEKQYKLIDIGSHFITHSEKNNTYYVNLHGE